MPQSISDVGHATVARAAKKKGASVRRFSHNHQCGQSDCATKGVLADSCDCVSKLGTTVDKHGTGTAITSWSPGSGEPVARWYHLRNRREGVTRVSHRQQRESIVVRSRLTQPPCVARRRYFKITLRLAISHEFRGLRPLLVLVLTGTHPRRIGRGRRACSRSHHSMMHALLTVDEHVSGGCSYERYVLGPPFSRAFEAAKKPAR